MGSLKTLGREKIAPLNSSVSALHFSSICKKTNFNWGWYGANLLLRKAYVLLFPMLHGGAQTANVCLTWLSSNFNFNKTSGFLIIKSQYPLLHN